jgi:hypothetical protein
VQPQKKIYISKLDIQPCPINDLDLVNKFNVIVSKRGSGKTELAKSIYTTLELNTDDLFIISPSAMFDYFDMTDIVRRDTTELNKIVALCKDPNLIHRKKLLILDNCLSSHDKFLINPDLDLLALFKNLDLYNTTVIVICQYFYFNPKNLAYKIDNLFFGRENFKADRNKIHERVFNFIRYKKHFHDFFMNNTNDFTFIYLKTDQVYNYFVKTVKAGADAPSKKINTVLN